MGDAAVKIFCFASRGWALERRRSLAKAKRDSMEGGYSCRRPRIRIGALPRQQVRKKNVIASDLNSHVGYDFDLSRAYAYL
jgi:hypothetical protein